MSPDDGTTGDQGAVQGQVVLPSDPAAIEALIAERRANLASTIDELMVRAHPKEIARRSAADAKGRVQAFATTDDGQLRTERLAAVAAAATALLGLILLLRRRRGRAR
jgi:Protein of unknown function (DUF3618)